MGDHLFLLLGVSAATVFTLFVVLVAFFKWMTKARRRLGNEASAEDDEYDKIQRQRRRLLANVLGCIFRSIMISLGVLLIFTAILLIGFIVRFGLRDCLPLVITPGTIMFYVHTTFAYFLAFNILFNYALCVFTNPGNTNSKHYKRAVREGKEMGLIPSIDLEAMGSEKGKDKVPRPRGATQQMQSYSGPNIFDPVDPTEWRVCGRSKVIKPPRSHFDAVSGKIVLNMDHFCPWMSNTIGYANYRYFLLMLFWTFVGCAYVVVMLTPHVILHGVNYDFSLLLIYLTSFSFSAVLTLFLAFHAMLISTGQTTIGFWKNIALRARARKNKEPIPVNPFNLGTKLNWQRVFGDMHWTLAILPSVREPPWPPYATLDDVKAGRIDFGSAKRI
mmetsp:Transcript_2477/g.3568  ORF Transcript_2477/g.3568 Transcript_2477/m.3568 type:complete len:388 (+) Transcript_2477:72-1235(+)|eukprot:CAMPEP_0167745478 /NCGR_PEP_ID=MMETSP0110_2-20121227/3172_1 /TAXON_ID=629695 /ORGANISM="Gymnochlora sp., Strain CCMP2014" /LENGTH=387 /DNA_ID=CAMNT_0007630121 /DNA_START=33 /DNA_END=1196 /DNA_ORIENTATION=-